MDEVQSVSTPQMAEELRRFIVDEVLLDGSMADLSVDDELLDEGAIDSLGVMRLIGFIEQRFGYRTPPEDITIENFLSISAIVAYLQPRLQADC